MRTMKFVLATVILSLLVIAAFAETRYIMASGSGTSTDSVEASAKASTGAQSNLVNECGGRLRQVHISVSCIAAGGGYTSCTAWANGNCETLDPAQARSQQPA